MLTHFDKKKPFKTNSFIKQEIHLAKMNFGSVSPSGVHILSSPIAIRGKNGSKLNITGLRDTSNSKQGAGLYHNQTTPLIFGSQKQRREKNIGILGILDSNLPSRGHEQSRTFGSNEDINQNYKNNNRNWNDSSNFLSISNLKSRVPEIQMINKYYGLIPKKFTMHSRHSADLNQRSSRSGTKLRAKSAITLISTKKSSLDDSDSTSEYNEPTVKARRGSSGGRNRSQEIGDKSSSFENRQNHVELVTTKMSVEKQHKKWRHRRSVSLSLVENGLQPNCHATKSATVNSCKEAQRVIKIDLNNMSWEETYQSNATSDEPQSPSPDRSPRYMNNINFNAPYNIPTFDDEMTINTTRSRNTSQTFHNSPSNPLSSKSLSTGCGSANSIRTINNNLALNQHQPTPNSVESMNQVGDSSIVLAQVQNQNTLNKAIGNVNNGIDPKTSVPLLRESCGLGTVAIESDSTPSGNRRQRLRKTISFDEQLLRSSDNASVGSSTPGSRPDTEAMKPRRPMTASTRLSPVYSNNNQNQPSKVHPWTQRSGQGMSISERRAKLQKSISIHSSDSFDYGDGEGSDYETETSSINTNMSSKNTTVANIPGPNSSAYKETRKSLFFHPPPEVSTMMSLVSPIETLEIQYEIEKVAVMLKNMQNQNKSFIDLCPADSSSPTPSSSKINTAVRNAKKDNDFAKDSRDDINGNRTAPNTFPSGDKVAIPEGMKTRGTSLEKAGETNGGGDSNAAFGKSQTGTDGFESPCRTDTAMDLKNVWKPQEQDCNLVTSLGDDIGGRSSIKDESPTQCGSCTSDPILLKVQALPPSLPLPILPSNLGTRRPPLKKSVSISCEKELWQTPGWQNEVNGNGTSSQPDENKGSRPKTAAISTFSTSGQSTPKPFLLSRSSSTSTIALTSSTNSHRTRPKVSNPNPNHPRITKADRLTPTGKNNEKAIADIGTTLPGESNQSQSQALRNRKILIKKALIEINQSSALLGKKWGILGRPKTAPSPGASNNNKKPVTIPNAMMTCGQNQKRQPLKASPPSATGVKPGQAVGKGVIQNQRIDQKGENNALGENKVEPEAEMEDSVPTGGNSRRTLHRQSFSLDEGLLLGFSNKEFGWNSSDGTCDDSSKGREEVSFLSTKKREECLKIYEKMMKTGFAVKLDTIFRGMMTPSEYRAFIKAAEIAAREAADEAAAAEEETMENTTGKKAVDAGVKSVSSSEEPKVSI